MGRLIDTSNIRVKPQYIQDVMGIAMIRCEDLSRILADVPTVEAIPKADYENRLKADMVAMLTEIQLEIEELYPKARRTYRDGLTSYCEGVDDSRELIQQKIDALKDN